MTTRYLYALTALVLCASATSAAEDDPIHRSTYGGCVTAADCADLDADFIRDDNCMYWECVAGSCVGSDILFGDMSGMFGACVPNGAIDANDALQALSCFETLSTCEATAPNAYTVDAGGRFGACPPDGVCDAHDYYHAYGTFFGTSNCTCGAAPAPTGSSRKVQGAGGARVFMAVDGVQYDVATTGSTTLFMDPGTIRRIMVWIEDTTAGEALESYQVMLPTEATPLAGASGSISYLDDNPGTGQGGSIHVDTTRGDWVYHAVTVVGFPLYHESAGAIGTFERLLLGNDEADPADLGAVGYLAEFDLIASADACGSFELGLLRTPQLPPVPLADLFLPGGDEYPVDEYQSLIIHLGPRNDDCVDYQFVTETFTPFDTTCATADGPQDCAADADIWFAFESNALEIGVDASGADVVVYGPFADGVPCPPPTGGSCNPSVLFGQDGTYLVQVLGADMAGALQVFGVCGGGGCSMDADCDDGNACTINTCTACGCTTTTTVQQCADTNDDGIRDDNCIWHPCGVDECAGIGIVFADMGGQFGTCEPDGTADGNDQFHALNCFANVDTDQSAGYPCEPDAPNALNVDAGGPFGACPPDGVCDSNDAFHALNKFSGVSTCSCPLDGEPAPLPPAGQPVVASAELRLDVTRRTLEPGALVDVDVYLAAPLQDLRGYQLHLAASGGESGTLDLVDIAIAPPRAHRMNSKTRSVHANARHVFADAAFWQAFNITTRQMLAGLDTPGISVKGGYLATFTYRASADARGSFAIDVLSDATDAAQRTFLHPTRSDGVIQIANTGPAAVTITTHP